MDLIDRDVRKADEFLSSVDDLDALLSKYDRDVDGELRGDEVKLAVYLMLREQGVAHVWAASRACRRCGRMLNSAGSFDEFERRKMANMPEWQRSHYLREASKAGISVQGKVYMGGLGRPDEPHAWVSEKADVETVARERNMSVSGHVKHEAKPVAPQRTQLADDLVDEMCQAEMKNDPALAERCRKKPDEFRRLRGAVVEKYGTPKSKLNRRSRIA